MSTIRRIPRVVHSTALLVPKQPTIPIATQSRVYSVEKQESPKNESQTASKPGNASQPEAPKKKKTQAELDEELREKMSGLAGDGGEAGLELEDGQPVSMKRSVKNNMFRYI
ncbi:hypothetical protein LTR66_001215 [Elasticomyces elasticus]|nr:hypothetical protein LTR28_005617 [Elasticomyces elasticus]KAK4992539.1 hypothetical protein LTR50_001081 [Elasticomyces elasticus]KAK4999831.1 hypothetical protein LTR66_001215 [Elasticomyces elasticus]